MLKHLWFNSLFISVTVMALLLGESANASRARLIALGQAGPDALSTAANLPLGQGGTASLYIEDHRSVFQNPAYLAKYAQFANFEMGSNVSGSVPNAEGGLFLSRGDLKFGIQLGRETNASSLITGANALLGLTVPAAPAVDPTLMAPNNGFEVILAGGGAMKWGAGFLFATSDDKNPASNAFPNKKANTFEARAGILQDKLSAYGKLLLIASSETETASGTSNKFDAKPGLEAGGAFDVASDLKVWGTFGYYMYSVRNPPPTTDRDGTYSYFSAGATHFLTPEAPTRMFASAALTFANAKINSAGTATEIKSERIYVPVVIGIENQTYDWITTRVSVRQNVLFDQQKNTNTTDFNAPNTTIVAVGPGFKWKRLLLDTVLAGSVTGNINATTLFANAGLTYTF